MSDDLDELRTQAEEVQGWVRAGRYPEAMARLAELHAAWSERLGAEHPEVVELRLDLQTVADMAGVADFGRSVGFRWHGLPEDLLSGR